MPNNTEIKAIETYYNGYKFRSRLEARWAVFFDNLGIRYEYEPEGYKLSNGMCYLPDFLLHDIKFCHDGELYVEVKGVMNDDSLEKIVEFSKSHCILVLGDIPKCGTLEEIEDHIRTSAENENYNFCLFSNGDCDGCLYRLIKIKDTNDKECAALITCCYADIEYPGCYTSETETLYAYQSARKARFEYADAEPREPTKKPREKEKQQKKSDESGKFNLPRCVVTAFKKGPIEVEGTRKRVYKICDDLYLYARCIKADSEKEVIKSLSHFINMQFDTFSFEVDADNKMPGTNIKYAFDLKRYSKVSRSDVVTKAVKCLTDNVQILRKAEKLFETVEDEDMKAFQFALYANENFEEPLRTCVIRDSVGELEKIFNEYGE